MRAFLPKSFQREAKSHGISDDECREAVRRAEIGLVDANLGGRLIKQRIARSGQGASRGFRAIVFYKRGEIAVFLHLFAKSDKANLTKSEFAEYSKLAEFLEKLTEGKLKELGTARGWKELDI